MNCKQVRSNLAAYVLGELDLHDEQVFEQHLKECVPCQDAMLHARREASRVSEALKTDLLAPQGLLPAVRSRIGATAPRRQSLRFLLPALAATLLAAFVVFATGQYRTGQDNSSPAQVVESADSLFDKSVIPRDTNTVALSNEVGFNVQLPTLKGASFVGACCAWVSGRHTAALVYRRGSVRIIVFQMPRYAVALDHMNHHTVAGRRFHCCSRGRRSLIAWEESRSVFVLTGDMPEKELVAML